MSVRVSYTDGGGTNESVTSSATPLVSNVNDAPTGEVTVSGTARVGQTLSSSTATLADEDGLGALSLQWLRGGVAITGATAPSYTLTSADAGAVISLRVSYTDGQGTPEATAMTTLAAALTMTPLKVATAMM
jgi:hypothetical protein